MITLPSESFGEGRFDRDKAFSLFNSAGDPDEQGNLPIPERLLSLNGMAFGECLGKSAAIAKGDQWGFTLVLKGGDQFVYVGTPSEAANGNGGARIEGVVSVASWATKRIRKPLVAKRKAPPPPPNDATFWAQADYVGTCCFTQDPTATRSDFNDKLGDLNMIYSKLGVKGPNEPVVNTDLIEAPCILEVKGADPVVTPPPHSPIRRGPPIGVTWRIPSRVNAPIPVPKSKYDLVGDSLVLRQVD